MNRLLIILALLAGSSLAASESDSDSVFAVAAAFYEGSAVDYVIPPPPGFRMVLAEALADGYSFAFVPDTVAYGNADVLIGAHLFNLTGTSFDEALTADTSSLREHYGKNLDLWAVESVVTATGGPVPTFYINDKTRFIPDVMVSYLDGGADMLVLELIIAEHIFRATAEESFLTCLRYSKLLTRAELSKHSP